MGKNWGPGPASKMLIFMYRRAEANTWQKRGSKDQKNFDYLDK